MLVIEPTGSACGAIVKGIDLNKPISPTLMEKLVWTLYQHRCLVIKNQELTKESYYQFASQWGELIQHVLDYLRMPDYPEMMAIGNTEEKDKDVTQKYVDLHIDMGIEAMTKIGDEGEKIKHFKY